LPQFIDYYAVLGVSIRASSSDIKKAYRTKARIHHPDAGGNEQTFRQVKEAYDVLKNEQSRKRYDQVYEHYYTPSSRPRPQPVKKRAETSALTPKKYIPIGSYFLIGLIILLCLFTIFSFFSESFFH